MYVHGRVAPGECRAARKAGREKVLQSWGVGCRSGDKCQRSIYSVCRVYVHGRVAPRKCRAARKAAKGGRSYSADKCSAQAVGSVTSVSEVHIVCIQCTYMESRSREV